MAKLIVDVESGQRRNALPRPLRLAALTPESVQGSHQTQVIQDRRQKIIS